MQPIYHSSFVKDLFLTGFEDFLGPLQGVALDLDQLVDITDFFYIILGKPSVSLFVLLGFDDIEFSLPISYQ